MTFWSDDHEAFIGLCHIRQELSCTVGRVVVHHNHIEIEVGFLCQCTLHSIADGLGTIENRDNDRGFNLKFLFLEVDIFVLCSIHHSVDSPQMCCAGAFHLYLHFAVGRIDIVKLLDT